MKARANTRTLSVDPYRSDTERKWANDARLQILGIRPETVVLESRYEPLSLIVPGGRYTPDFLHILDTGETVFVEVKGSKKQPNYRDARSKLRAAAEMFPFWTFIEARRDGGGWTLEEI